MNAKERRLLDDLERALATGGLRLAYQPKVATDDGRLVRVEALVRWQHPTLGAVPPVQFVPLAEDHGLIDDLTKWALRTALRQWRDWHHEGLDTDVAVNISAMSLEQLDFPDLVERLCELATWAPNHKKTWPWRFASFTGDGRARLGEAFVADMVERGFGDEGKRAKTLTKYLRTPTVVVVGSAPHEHPTFADENRLAVAAGVENLLLGATAAGLASFWSTAPLDDSPRALQLCAFEPGTRIVAVKNVTATEPHFAGHFPGQAVMPGVLIIEAAAQAVAIMCRTGTSGEARAYLANTTMSFRQVVTPGDQMLIEARVFRRMANLLIAKVKVRVAGVVVADGEITVAQKD